MICLRCKEKFAAPGGAIVVCPGCGAELRVKARTGPGSEPTLEASAAAPTEARPANPRRAKRRKPAPTDTNTRRLLLIAGGGGAVLVATLIGLVVWLCSGREQEKPVAGGEPAPPAEAAPQNPFPDIPWNVPSGGVRTRPISTETVSVPGAQLVLLLPGPAGAFLAWAEQPAVTFGRVDPATGRPTGEPVALGGKPSPYSHQTLYDAALSPNGWLAVRPLRVGPIHVYAPGTTEPRPIGDFEERPDWFDWSADNRLLIVAGGKLTAWDVDGGKPAYQVGAEYRGPVALAPARNWLVLAVGPSQNVHPHEAKYLEVVDAATGQCRGRLGGEGKWMTLAVSADGSRLAGYRYAGPGINPVHSDDYYYEVRDWDLATGRQLGAVKFYNSSGAILMLLGPNRAVVGAQLKAIDLNSHVVVGTHPFPERPVGFYQVRGDDRVWWRGDKPGQLRALSGQVTDDPSIVFKPGVAVNVEAACGDGDRDRRAAAALAGAVRQAGYPAGGGGWTLRVTAQEVDSDFSMTMTGTGKSITVPMVRGEIQLIAPDGQVVQMVKHVGRFPGQQSKYFKKSAAVLTGGGGVASEQSYDFGGRDPRAAMVEEAWERFVATLSATEWPRGARKSGGKYLPLQ
jgi:hypothetical protein